MSRFIASIVLLLHCGQASFAEHDAPRYIRTPDQARLFAFGQMPQHILLRAFAQGSPAHVAVLSEALSGTAQQLDPVGSWSCRTIKMGRLVPLVVYRNFNCRITANSEGGWTLEKLSGSQRTKGQIWDWHGAVYTGVGFVDGGPAVSYENLPPEDQTPVEPGQTTAEVGVFEQMGPNRARLFLPRPILESELNILYLTR